MAVSKAKQTCTDTLTHAHLAAVAIHVLPAPLSDPINARKFAVKCELPPDLKQALCYLEEDFSPPPPSHMSYIPPQPQPSPSPITTQEDSKPAAIDEQEDSVMVDGERKEEDQNQSPVDKDGKQGGQGEGDGARVEDVEMAPAPAAVDDNGADNKDEAAEEAKKSDEKPAEGDRDRPALPVPAVAAVVPPEWSSYPFYDICRTHSPLTEMQALAASIDAEIEAELQKERERLDEERQRRDKERSLKMERERVKREKDAADKKDKKDKKDKRDKTPVPAKRGDSPSSKMTSASRRRKKLGDVAARGGRSEGSPEGERGGEEDADGRGRKRQRSAPRSAKDSEEITPSNRRKANGIKEVSMDGGRGHTQKHACMFASIVLSVSCPSLVGSDGRVPDTQGDLPAACVIRWGVSRQLPRQSQSQCPPHPLSPPTEGRRAYHTPRHPTRQGQGQEGAGRQQRPEQRCQEAPH